jgi:hypothetical protein
MRALRPRGLTFLDARCEAGFVTEDPVRLFDAVTEALEHDPSIGKGWGFGSSALKVGGKIFAMLVDEKLVVKLPRARVQELVAEGRGTQFDPGHGRLMKEWVSVPATDPTEWIALAEEARAYVDAAR